ncbi:hypothetical protein EDB89DRAFT_2069861 [Lactarius sanguifluus]|nr:hypothetical protein EDB89DRAFT_2069861 [Lactarius sanguifluus]
MDVSEIRRAMDPRDAPSLTALATAATSHSFTVCTTNATPLFASTLHRHLQEPYVRLEGSSRRASHSAPLVHLLRPRQVLPQNETPAEDIPAYIVDEILTDLHKGDIGWEGRSHVTEAFRLIGDIVELRGALHSMLCGRFRCQIRRSLRNGITVPGQTHPSIFEETLAAQFFSA